MVGGGVVCCLVFSYPEKPLGFAETSFEGRFLCYHSLWKSFYETRVGIDFQICGVFNFSW